MGKKRAERGDTLVEVTVAMAVLGLMLAASLAVINRGLMGVSNAVERTSVRASLSSQSYCATSLTIRSLMRRLIRRSLSVLIQMQVLVKMAARLVMVASI